jgi:hypothetical protein
VVRFAIALFLVANSAFAQDSKLLDAVEGMTGVLREGMSKSGTEIEWGLSLPNAEAQEIMRALSKSGYIVPLDAAWLTAADQFDLYSNPIAPGEVGYLVVPNAVGAQPVTYAPLRFTKGVGRESAMLVAGFTADDIADRILDGMQKSIAQICRIGAQPDTITGRASAVGIVEIEATWKGSDVCAAVAK